jgi:hypothetical protein
MKKIVFIAAMIAAFVISACQQKKTDAQKQETETITSPVEETVVPVEETVIPFSYQPALPQDGTKKGIVELGATGFNWFIVNLDKEKNWHLEKAKFGESGVLEGKSTEADVTNRLKEFIRGILDAGGGVKGSNIYFVVSSGAKDEESLKPSLSALKKLGYVVNTVTPEQEGTCVFKSVVPKEYENRAFAVDMGSGNTKIAWMENGKVVATSTYGAKYYLDNGLDAQKVYQDVSKIVAAIPESSREVCFIIGGVPFAMSKVFNTDNSRYTVLRSEKSYTSDDFKDDKSLAGLNIYKALRDAGGCKQFVFDKDANFSIGFLLGFGY